MDEITSIVNSSILMPELEFSTSRSSGPGGQNVNKVNSKVTLKLNIPASQVLSEEQKRLLMEKLRAKLTNDGLLIISSQEKRSQSENKETALQKLDSLIKRALTPRKTRKKTKPSKGALEDRIKEKKKRSEKKKWRQKL